MSCIYFFYSAGPVERSQSQSVAILHFFFGGGGGNYFNALITLPGLKEMSIGTSAPLKEVMSESSIFESRKVFAGVIASC